MSTGPQVTRDTAMDLRQPSYEQLESRTPSLYYDGKTSSELVLLFAEIFSKQTAFLMSLDAKAANLERFETISIPQSGPLIQLKGTTPLLAIILIGSPARIFPALLSLDVVPHRTALGAFARCCWRLISSHAVSFHLPHMSLRRTQ
jgi:hypothetical protein